MQGNNDAQSYSHCCRGKAVSIKYSECVSVFLSSLSGKQGACAAYVGSFLSCLTDKRPPDVPLTLRRTPGFGKLNSQ